MCHLQIKFSKHYPNETEENRAMNIFLEHKKEIDKHNELYKNGLVSFKMDINKYSDLTSDQFAIHMNGLNFNEYTIKKLIHIFKKIH